MVGLTLQRQIQTRHFKVIFGMGYVQYQSNDFVLKQQYHDNYDKNYCIVTARCMMFTNGDALRGDVKIPQSRMTKTCWETLETCL